MRDDEPSIPPPELVAESRTKPKGSRRGDAEPEVESEYENTELGNAFRIIAKADGKIRWSSALQGEGFVMWDGKRWRADMTGSAHRLAKRSALDIMVEARDQHGARRERDMKWAIRSQKASTIESALRLARTEKEMSVGIDQLDQNTNRLNVANGTIDLPSDTILPHERNHLLTKIAKVEHDVKADAPAFDHFLARVQPDATVRAYLRRFVGYCLSGDTSEQVFAVHQGGGANGKTTFWETIVRLLGDYAITMPFSTFAHKQNGNEASNDVAALNGSRLVMASETPEAGKLNVALVKRLTGGEQVTARFLYKEYFTFTPTFKIVLVTNHRPSIDESGHAIWRRIHIVPWSVTIPEAERDYTLGRKLLDELPGILNWALEGYAEWRRIGLAPPPSMLLAKDDYRDEEDSLGSFLDERMHVAPEDMTIHMKAGAILASYSEWAKANGADPLSAKGIASKLRERKLTPKKMAGMRVWFGIRGLDRGDHDGELMAT